MGQRSQNGIQNLVEILANVLGEKPEDQIAVLLKQGIFSTISPVGVRVAQMLAAVQFNGESGLHTQEVDLHATPTIEWNR